MRKSFLIFDIIIFIAAGEIFSFYKSNNFKGCWFIEDTVVAETLPGVPFYEPGDIYVSGNGSDETGLGTKESPFKTIAHALESAEAGNVIVLRNGSYLITEEIRIRIPDITIRSEVGEWAVITAPTHNEDISICVYFDVESSGGKLQRLEIVGGYYYGVKTETKWDWGDPNDRGGASNILIEDCVIHDTGRDCIKITPNCDDIIIRRCEIFNSGVRDDSNAEGIDNVNADRMIVQDCYIHDIATNGLYFKGGATLCVVERARIDNCGVGGIMVGFDTSPEYFDLTVNPDYYEAIYGIVRNCVISNTKYAGIGLYAAKNAKIFNNTIINTGQDGHSPVYFGISFQDWEPEAKRPPSIYPTIMNNIIYQSAGISSPAISIRHTDDLGGLSALEGLPNMDYNCYYIEGGEFYFDDRRPGSFVENGSFINWQNHISNEMNSHEANPDLDEDYRLSETSFCIGEGVSNNYVSFDIDRQPRDSAYDIGADEFSNAVFMQDEISVNEFRLYQNFPNPFNPTTSIKFQVPTTEKIQINVYDILGNQVMVLLDEEKSPGDYQIEFNARPLASGIYIYQLRTGSFVSSKKLILLK